MELLLLFISHSSYIVNEIKFQAVYTLADIINLPKQEDLLFVALNRLRVKKMMRILIVLIALIASVNAFGMSIKILILY